MSTGAVGLGDLGWGTGALCNIRSSNNDLGIPFSLHKLQRHLVSCGGMVTPNTKL